MGLEYSIFDSNENYYEVNITVASYYKDEGLFLNATVQNHWRGFNDESFSWERVEDKVVLSDDVEEKVIDELSLEEFKQWLNTLNDIYSHLEMFQPTMDILKNLVNYDNTRVSIYFD